MIRTFQSSDVEPIVNVWFKSSSFAHPFLKPAFMEKEKDNIRNIYLPNTKTWIYEYEGKLIGFISMMQNEVGAIFLDPSFHGRGFGKALMDTVAQLYPILEVEVFKENPVGRRFYDRYGFKYLKEYYHEETGQVVLRLRYITLLA